MRILYLVSGFAPAWGLGGGVRVSYELSKEMASKGHDVEVYTTDIFDYESRIGYKYKNWNGVKTYYFKAVSNYLAKKKFNISLELIFYLYKNIESFDIVHFHEYRTLSSTFAAYFCQQKNVPYVLQAHGSLPATIGLEKFKLLYDLLFRNYILNGASKIIALNEMEAEQYKSIGIEETKIEIIPNGINYSEYQDLPKKGSFKLKYNINPNYKIVLYLGRIDRIKGIDLLLDSFSELSNELNNIFLVVVGPESEFLNTLREKTINLNIENKVLFTGPLYESKKLEAYVDADIYVLPSRYEMFPNTVLEACLCGLPVIVTNRCGISDLVNNNFGYATPFDKESLKSSMYKILSDEKLAKYFSDNGMKMIRSSFEWSNISKRIEHVYLGICLNNG